MGKTSAHLRRKPSARIDHRRDSERDYLIAPENRDLFVRTGRQVIAACNMQMRIERWLEVYEAMLGSVRDFAEDHAEHIAECYAVPRNAKTVLSFVPKSAEFDFELANELAKLQFDFQRRFANLVGAIEVGQVPGWDLPRFLDSQAAQRVYPPQDAKSNP
ncbi:MAG TPA: hypothetical protein VH370_17615 [Humisphaera sp.]|jgi:hypothetical protein|nr:hypothetical protein [Humisphaera sp.]